MEEVMILVLKVDLECHKCYRKIKKLLCKYPEIRDQTYFEKEDTVIIKVVCCSPERIRQKLICKGGKTIKSIEIRVPEKHKPPVPEKPKEADQKPQEAGKPKPTDQKPQEAGKPKPTAEKSNPNEAEKSKPAAEKPKKVDQKPNVPAPAPNPVTGYPPMYPYGVCCKQCFEGHGGGPCQSHHGYGIPYQLQPPSSYDGWPSGCHCDRSYGCRCEYYTENYPPCTIM